MLTVSTEELQRLANELYTEDLCLFLGATEQELHKELQKANISIQKGETIEDFVESAYPGTIEFKNTTEIPGSIIDVWLPTIRVGIILNKTYSSCDQQISKTKHFDNHEIAIKNDVHLIQLHQTQWDTKKEIVKERLITKLGIQTNKTYARMCDVQVVPSSVARTFCNKHHIQGFTNAKFHYMLYCNLVPIAYMSFNTPRAAMNQRGYDYELVRYCSNGTVVGGASKLFKAFIRDEDPTAIRSFSDNDWNSGGLYGTLGFVFEGYLTAGYWYVKDNRFIHRYNFTKKSLVSDGFDENKTEFVIMDERGYYRYYDSGNTKWMWNKK